MPKRTIFCRPAANHISTIDGQLQVMSALTVSSPPGLDKHLSNRSSVDVGPGSNVG